MDSVLTTFRRQCIGAMILGLLALTCLYASQTCGAEGVPKRPVTVMGPPSPTFETNLPKIEVVLSRPVYVIRSDPKTGKPIMPTDVIALARPIAWPLTTAPPASFTWQVFLDWDFKPYPTHHSIQSRTITQSSPLKVNFGEEIRGGTLTVVAKTQFNGREISGQAYGRVLGENPNHAFVLSAFPNSRFGLIASKIGMAESGLMQFGKDGFPSISHTNDVGMMQINAPSGAVTSADEVWDWRANLRRGLQMLQGKRQITVLASRHAVNLRRDIDLTDPNFQTLAYLNCARLLLGLAPTSVPSPPELSEKRGSGCMPGDPDPDRLALSQIERESIRRYNGGREYVYRFVPDPRTLELVPAGWDIDTTRGGVRAKSGDPDYVRHVLNARSGFKLPDPPKTKKKHHGRRRHHHSA